MMGGWGFSPFSWVGMTFMWLIPLGFIVLAVLGVAWLVRLMGGRPNKDALGQACPSCGRAIQVDWNHCPNCGASLMR
ncbi:MAG: zinc ribbon domain-containing protein, partial [Chloroflexota bacterium]